MSIKNWLSFLESPNYIIGDDEDIELSGSEIMIIHQVGTEFFNETFFKLYEPIVVFERRCGDLQYQLIRHPNILATNVSLAKSRIPYPPVPCYRSQTRRAGIDRPGL